MREEIRVLCDNHGLNSGRKGKGLLNLGKGAFF